MPPTPPCIFLSHSGADSEAARDLKRRLLAAPDARAAGLRVWLDKDDLRPGGQWQPQIEQAIANATAFVVYVGSKGVMNWVEAEVRVALSRANADKGFLFIPALAADSAGSGALPPFAKLYQGVRDPLGLGEELAKLLKAVLGAPWDKAPTLTGEPFVGLRSMHEEEADRFFGRDKEIAELVVKLRRRRIVAIVADSGTGKSSLAQAGLAPAFRGGMLADPSRENPDDRIWNVVTMRPRASPEEGLRTGITEAAKMLGQSPDARAGLRNRTSIADASETAFALQCDLPARDTATLLIVDQFEELFTSTPDALVAPFVELLLDLANGDKDFRILLTVRSDYFNLMSDIKDAAGEAIRGADGKTLFERLNAEGGDAILRLKRISDEGLSDAICKPLRLAGVKDDQTPLVKAVQRDISDQPSDLPLLQVALKAAWREHKATNLGLLEAYHSVGGVLGALAREAEKIRTTKLSADDQARLESIFVRLVRLGDTGGATRRTVSLSEFDDARRNLLQRLGDDEHGRLVAVGEDKAEIAHEALITQWPWLQERLNNKENATYARLLDRLMAKSRDWIEAGKTDGYVARGVERELFDVLANSRPDWLSGVDRDFVESSNRSHKAELDERQAQNKAVRRNASLALTALADLEAERRPMNAAKLALAAWPRDVTDKMTPKLEETLHVLIGVMPHLRLRRVIKRAADLIAFSPDGSLIAATFIQSTEVQILNAGSGTLVRTLRGHTGPVTSAAFRGTQIVTASTDKTARLWDTDSGNEIAVLRGHENWVRSASFSPDGARVVTASDDGTARVWDVASGTEILTLNGHGSGARPIALDPDRGLLDMEGLTVRSAAFSPDGTSVVTASADRSVRVWDVVSKHSGPNGLWARFVAGVRKLVFGQKSDRKPIDRSDERKPTTQMTHEGAVYSAVFSPDGQRILTASADSSARIWDRSSGRELFALREHMGQVNSATFSPDGTYVITASDDRTVRLWESAAGREIAALRGLGERVSFATFSPDGGQIVAASSNYIRLWDVWGGRVSLLQGHKDLVSGAAFSPVNMQVVTWSWDKTARIWSATSDRQTSLEGHDGPIRFAAFSPDGARVVTASQDRTARVWDIVTGRRIGVPIWHEGPLNSATFSANGTHIVTASEDTTARIWDAAMGHEIAALKGHDGSVVSATFDRGSARVVTASRDGTARIWDATNGHQITVLKGHEGEVRSATFRLDGTRVVTASYDKTARIWDAASGGEIAALRTHNDIVCSAAFSPDGTRVVTASKDGSARIWDGINGRVLEGHDDAVNYAAFSLDGTRVVTASRDATARIWDTASGAELAVLRGHEGSVSSAAFDRDGGQVVTTSNKEARVWDISAIPRGNLFRVVCTLLKRHEDPVSLEGVTAYPFEFDPLTVCETDPPPPDLLAEPASTSARREEV